MNEGYVDRSYLDIQQVLRSLSIDVRYKNLNYA